MTDILQFKLKDGRTILVDFLSVDSLLCHKADMKEITEQLENEWHYSLNENINKMHKWFSNDAWTHRPHPIIIRN